MSSSHNNEIDSKDDEIPFQEVREPQRTYKPRDLYKTTPCKNQFFDPENPSKTIEGTCSYGDVCMYAHMASELRKPGSARPPRKFLPRRQPQADDLSEFPPLNGEDGESSKPWGDRVDEVRISAGDRVDEVRISAAMETLKEAGVKMGDSKSGNYSTVAKSQPAKPQKKQQILLVSPSIPAFLLLDALQKRMKVEGFDGYTVTITPPN